MPTLRDFLEKINIRAAIAYDEPMSRHTTFGIGGPADALVLPRDPESAALLASSARAEGIPVLAIGGGANILVGDRGVRGVVLDCGALRSVRVESRPDGSALLVAGAGLSMDELCVEALARGLGGVENFAGMPGTVGGSVVMNARCFEREIADVLAWTEYVEGDRVERRPTRAEEWSYKRSPFQAAPERAAADGAAGAREPATRVSPLVLAAAFRLAPADPVATAAAMRGRRLEREAKGHYRLPSAGSVFKNDRRLGRPSGKILDELGLRGRRIGGAMVSPWHANIFVNAGGASAADMRALIDLAREEARARAGAELEPEVVLVGEF